MKFKKNLIRGLLIALLLCIFYIIFGFSSQDGNTSGSLSKRITAMILNKVPNIENITYKERQKIMIKVERVIRKTAHFSIYTVVGVITMGWLMTYNLNDKRRLYITLIIGALYAFSDEIHQSFIPQRTAKITDVMIDTMGVILGILIILMIKKIYYKISIKTAKKVEN